MMSALAKAMPSDRLEAMIASSGAWIDDDVALIGTPEAASTYFSLAMATGDRDIVLGCLNSLAHSKGMADALAWAGLPCDIVSRALEAKGRRFMQALSDVSDCLTPCLVEPMMIEQSS